MSFFSKSRPQNSFESLWSESFFVTHLIWEMTLALHFSDDGDVKKEVLDFLEKKDKEVFQMNEKLFELRKEIVETVNKSFPSLYNQEWTSFIKELSSFQTDLTPQLSRLFLLKDILLQIDNDHPKRNEIEEAYKKGFESLLKAKESTSKILTDEKSSEAVFDAITIARSINEEINFEEAEKAERKRWE